MIVSDILWMNQALIQARLAANLGEVPVGAVVVRDNRIIGRGHNRVIMDADPSAHAEIVALRDAGAASDNYRLPGATLYVTLEPCMMCTGAMVHARLARVVYGAADAKTGVVESCDHLHERPYLNHSLQIEGGILTGVSAQLLRSFFQKKRKSKR